MAPPHPHTTTLAELAAAIEAMDEGATTMFVSSAHALAHAERRAEVLRLARALTLIT